MPNWRKLLVFDLGTRFLLPTVYWRYRELLDLEFSTREEIETYQLTRLKELVQYAIEYVPYYREDLDIEIDFDNFTLQELNKFPILTKEMISENFDKLQSDDIDAFKIYTNTSGGSTGEPVEFIQTQDYWHKAVATKMFYAHINGKEFGDPEIKLWGSERDIQVGTIGLGEKLKNWLYNRRLLNSFVLSDDILESYIREWNRIKPQYVWTYVDSIFELVQYAEQHEISLHSPESIVTTAGPLYDEVRDSIKRVTGAKVINQYGSREVGDIASECPEEDGLHIFEYSHIVEILDSAGNPCPPGQVGEIYITLLTNLAMPLIRYKIGDTGVFHPKKVCACGRNFRLLRTISGRISDHFIAADGSLVYGEYITHIFYHMTWISQFQVIQHDISLIEVFIVTDSDPPASDLDQIRAEILRVLPQSRVKITFVDHIDKLSSGKYRYVFSKVKRPI